MSILIRELDMPKDGELLCININSYGRVSVSLDLTCKQIAKAVQVTPHLDFVDRKKLLEKAEEVTVYEWNGHYTAPKKIRVIKEEAVLEAEAINP